MSARRTAKELLIFNLTIQASLMTKNAEMMREIYEESTNATELDGAAVITKNWIEEIQQEINNENI